MSTAAPLPYALGGPVIDARIRAQDEDFRVDEVDAFEASGAGEWGRRFAVVAEARMKVGSAR